MIVPHSRLLFCTAAVTLPAALIGAAVPEAIPICLFLTVGFGVAATADAFWAGRNLAEIGVEIPAVTRMSKDRESKLDVRIRNASERRRYLRIALGWPAEVQ